MTDSNYKSEHNLDTMSKNLPLIFIVRNGFACFLVSPFQGLGSQTASEQSKEKKYGYQPYFVAELLWNSSKIKLYLCRYSTTPNMTKKNEWKTEISKAMPHKTHEQKFNVTNRNLTKITIIMKEQTLQRKKNTTAVEQIISISINMCFF